MLTSAVFAANDDSAIGCINALREAGYSVPDDVSIVGCDDIELSKWFVPALPTLSSRLQDHLPVQRTRHYICKLYYLSQSYYPPFIKFINLKTANKLYFKNIITNLKSNVNK